MATSHASFSPHPLRCSTLNQRAPLCFRQIHAVYPEALQRSERRRGIGGSFQDLFHSDDRDD